MDVLEALSTSKWQKVLEEGQQQKSGWMCNLSILNKLIFRCPTGSRFIRHQLGLACRAVSTESRGALSCSLFIVGWDGGGGQSG